MIRKRNFLGTDRFKKKKMLLFFTIIIIMRFLVEFDLRFVMFYLYIFTTYMISKHLASFFY